MCTEERAPSKQWPFWVDTRVLLVCLGTKAAWAAPAASGQAVAEAAWASQSRWIIKPHLVALPHAWGAACSPQTCPAFLYVPSDALSMVILDSCLSCFHSGWLVCLVWPDTVALFYPSCPGTWRKPCGAVQCLGEMLSCIHTLLLKLADLMAKPILQYQFEMKGKVPGCCEVLWTTGKGRVCPWDHYIGVSWWK